MDHAVEPSELIPEAIRTPEPATADELSFWPEAEVPRPTRHATPRHTPNSNEPSRSDKPSPKPIGVAAGFSPRDTDLSNETGFSPGSFGSAASSAPRFAARFADNVHLPHLERNALHENRLAYRDSAPEEALALDEEIAYRHAPVFEEFTRRPEPLPANLIEFPRQLVASRKARPRFAEGPLREETESSDGQLRIFEVETAQISHAPIVEDTAAFPQWTSILLDAPQPTPATAPEPAVPTPVAPGPPGAASVARRITSAGVNGCIIGLALAAFAAAAMITSGNVDTLRALSMSTVLDLLRTTDGRSILGAGAIVGIIFTFIYQALFFTFSTATPGMRCTRIGLCTFDDNNPSRRAMRRRIVATLLSAVPFGLGFIWAALDEEKLSWHDRVSGMYQREY
jgi:uncharacterized RDD family membrane protein YckC